jgi:hypothetical protein
MLLSVTGGEHVALPQAKLDFDAGQQLRLMLFRTSNSKAWSSNRYSLERMSFVDVGSLSYGRKKTSVCFGKAATAGTRG